MALSSCSTGSASAVESSAFLTVEPAVRGGRLGSVVAVLPVAAFAICMAQEDSIEYATLRIHAAWHEHGRLHAGAMLVDSCLRFFDFAMVRAAHHRRQCVNWPVHTGLGSGSDGNVKSAISRTQLYNRALRSCDNLATTSQLHPGDTSYCQPFTQLLAAQVMAGW